MHAASENVLEEPLCRDRGAAFVEPQDLNPVDAGGSKRGEALLKAHDHPRRARGTEGLQRVSIERDDRRDGFQAARFTDDQVENFPMASVEAVEHPDGDDGATGGGRKARPCAIQRGLPSQAVPRARMSSTGIVRQESGARASSMR